MDGVGCIAGISRVLVGLTCLRVWCVPRLNAFGLADKCSCFFGVWGDFGSPPRVALENGPVSVPLVRGRAVSGEERKVEAAGEDGEEEK
jgi:hypothetical protein